MAGVPVTIQRALYGLILGSETESQETLTVAAETVLAYRFTSLYAGSVANIELLTGEGSNTGITSVVFGLYTAAVVLLGSQSYTGTPGAKEWFGATFGTAVPVKAGTEYYLAFVGLGSGNLNLKKRPGTGPRLINENQSSLTLSGATEQTAGPLIVMRGLGVHPQPVASIPAAPTTATIQTAAPVKAVPSAVKPFAVTV